MLYSELISDASAILRGPDISDLLFIYAKQAVRDIQKNPVSPIYENAKTDNIAVAASALEGNLPSDFGRAISAKFSGEENPITERHPRVFFEAGYPDNEDNFADEPTEFALYGTKILFNGVWSEAKTCVLRYSPWQPAPATASDTFPYSERLADVFLAKIVHLGFVDQRDEAAGVFWKGIYDQRLIEYFGSLLKIGHASQMAKTMITTR